MPIELRGLIAKLSKRACTKIVSMVHIFAFEEKSYVFYTCYVFKGCLDKLAKEEHGVNMTIIRSI